MPYRRVPATSPRSTANKYRFSAMLSACISWCGRITFSSSIMPWMLCRCKRQRQYRKEKPDIDRWVHKATAKILSPLSENAQHTRSIWWRDFRPTIINGTQRDRCAKKTRRFGIEYEPKHGNVNAHTNENRPKTNTEYKLNDETHHSVIGYRSDGWTESDASSPKITTKRKMWRRRLMFADGKEMR